jgi:VanZ family protein
MASRFGFELHVSEVLNPDFHIHTPRCSSPEKVTALPEHAAANRQPLQWKLMLGSRPWAGLIRALWVAGMGLVVVGSLLPANSAAIRSLSLLGLSDRVEHFAGYAALAFLPMLHERRGFVAWAAAGLVLLGVGLEFGQLESPGRSFEAGDITADALGVCAGLAAASIFRSRIRRAFISAPEERPAAAVR